MSQSGWSSIWHAACIWTPLVVTWGCHSRRRVIIHPETNNLPWMGLEPWGDVVAWSLDLEPTACILFRARFCDGLGSENVVAIRDPLRGFQRRRPRFWACELTWVDKRSSRLVTVLQVQGIQSFFLDFAGFEISFFFFLLDLVLCTGKEIWSSPDTAMTKPIRRGRPDVPARVNLRRNLGLGTPE